MVGVGVVGVDGQAVPLALPRLQLHRIGPGDGEGDGGGDGGKSEYIQMMTNEHEEKRNQRRR